MKSKVLYIIIFLSFSISYYSQQKVTWEDLSKVKFTDKYFPEHETSFLYPEFLPSVKALEGKVITIKGYFLSLDPEGEIYILSKGPMSSCFFCGVGGPETAIELEFKKTPSFKTDDIISITGTLKLNKDDVEHFNYILKESEGVLIK